MQLTQQRLDEIFSAHQSGNFELLLSLSKQLQIDFPDFVLGYKAAGVALLALNDIKAAIAEMKKTISIDPNDDEALANLGQTLINFAFTKQDIQQGQKYLEKYLALTTNTNTNTNNINTNDIYIRHLLSESYIKQADELYEFFPALALKKYNAAVKVESHNIDALLGLSKCYGDVGEIEKTFQILDTIETIKPNDINAYITKLRYSNYLPSICIIQMGKLAQQTKLLLSQHFKKVFPNITFEFNKNKYINDSKNKKFRLNIGFISGDFRNHAVAKFIKSLLEQLISNKTKFDFFAYPTVNKFDYMSGKLRPLFTKWKCISKLDDLAAAKEIYSDNIHILFDLSGYTTHSRLSIFALKPAPIQISWIGWFGTTAIEAMDYFIADEFCVPSGEKYEQQFCEKVLRMPNIWEVLTPPETKNLPPPPPRKIILVLFLQVLIIRTKSIPKRWIYGVKF